MTDPSPDEQVPIDASDKPIEPTREPVIASPAAGSGVIAEEFVLLVSEPDLQAIRNRRHPDAGWLRLVIVVWCFWLLGAWAVAWLSDTSVPRVRWMLFAGTFGLMLVWPAFRLSERTDDNRSGAIGTVLLDWLGMILVYQAVIWSLHLIALWPLLRGVWLDAAVVSWSLLTALIVAAARRWPGVIARCIGMLLCIALVFAEPIALWALGAAGQDGWVMRFSPIQVLWELTEPPSRGQSRQWEQPILTVALIAVMGWLALGAWALGERAMARKQADA